jgi:hypothetical protein
MEMINKEEREHNEKLIFRGGLDEMRITDQTSIIATHLSKNRPCWTIPYLSKNPSIA